VARRQLGLREKVIRGLETYLGVHFYRVKVRPLDLPAPQRATVPENIEIRRADLDELQEAVRDSELGISQWFLDSAIGRGDRCYAAFDNSQIVAYVWCSTDITHHEDDVGVGVSRPYVYGYKGLTRATHRGLRLNVALVAFAWQGWLYLAVVVDLFSRKVVGWSMNPSLARGIMLDALLMAVSRRRPKETVIVEYTKPATWHGLISSTTLNRSIIEPDDTATSVASVPRPLRRPHFEARRCHEYRGKSNVCLGY